MNRSRLVLLVLPLLAGCAKVAPPPAADPTPIHGVTPGHTCSSSNLQQFVGQVRSADLESRMLQVTGAATVRWVPQGTAVTMDFRFDRLTVFLDAQNKVERLSCS
jgi:hypothetical protein